MEKVKVVSRHEIEVLNALDSPYFGERFFLKSDVSACATVYLSGYYEGSGEAYVKMKDGTFRIIEIGHCSCRGPADTAWDLNIPDLTESEFEKLMEIRSKNPEAASIYVQPFRSAEAIKEAFKYLTGRELSK